MLLTSAFRHPLSDSSPEPVAPAMRTRVLICKWRGILGSAMMCEPSSMHSVYFLCLCNSAHCRYWGLYVGIVECKIARV